MEPDKISGDVVNLVALVREVLPFVNGCIIAWLAHRRYAADKQHEHDYRMLRLQIERLHRKMDGDAKLEDM